MELHEQISKKLYWIAIIALAFFIVSSIANVWLLFLQPKSHARLVCNDFGSYEDILSSYRIGNRGLDGDGDGIPCENRR